MSEVTVGSEKRSLPVWSGMALVWAGFLPLLYWHLSGLLSRPHYQFILLMPVALWLLWNSLESASAKDVTVTGRWFGVLLLLVSAAGLGYASLIWSPWIAAVCCLMASLGVMFAMLGMTEASRFVPIWLFCWILIPPPFGLDETIIVRLRTVTTNMTSAVLDQFGVLHQVYANVIELPGKPLFIADACSGIHSLYVLMGLALFLSVYTRRTVLHGVCLMATTFLIVLLENVSRIASVALAWQKGIDLSMGWKHEALGIVLFVLSALLILSTDQFLLFLLPADPIGWLKKLRAPGGKDRRRSGKSSRGSNLVWAKAALGIGGIFPALMVLQLTRMPEVPSLQGAFQSDLQLPEFGRGFLPAELVGFRLSNYESIQRVPGDPFGRSSQRWTYEKNGVSVGVSLDYPYEGVKDMTQCYENVGWTIGASRILSEQDLKVTYQLADANAPVAVAPIHRDLLGSATLLFSSFDLTGKTDAFVRPANRFDADTKVTARLESLKPEEVQAVSFNNPPYFQVHILTRSADPLTESQLTEVLRLYLECRRPLIQRVLSGNQPDSGNQVAGDQQ